MRGAIKNAEKFRRGGEVYSKSAVRTRSLRYNKSILRATTLSDRCGLQQRIEESSVPSFCFRLLFRLGMAVASDETEVKFHTTLCPHPLKLKARTGTLRTSRMLTIESCAYASEDEARGFGTRVLDAMLLGGVVRRLGVDFGTGKKRAQFSEDVKKKIAETGATLREELEGLDVYDEDLNTTFLVAEGHATVSGSPQDIIDLIDVAAGHSQALTERQRIAAELLNDSLFEVSTDASFLLRISAIEALCPQAPASAAYVTLATTLRGSIPSHVPKEDREAMERLLARDTARQSVRGAYMSKFRRLVGGQKANEFDELYNLRSKFLHEGLGRGKLLQPATAALNLAQELLLADVTSARLPACEQRTPAHQSQRRQSG
jgi:hypothetical protein